MSCVCDLNLTNVDFMDKTFWVLMVFVITKKHSLPIVSGWCLSADTVTTCILVRNI